MGDENATTQICDLGNKMRNGLEDYAGDYVEHYDMEAIYADYLSALNCELPDGVTVHANGLVFALYGLADQAREIDWDDLLNRVPVAPLFERHDYAYAPARAVIDWGGDLTDDGHGRIRLLNQAGNEIDTIEYAADDDEDAATANAQVALAGVDQLVVTGEWERDEFGVTRIPVARRPLTG